MTSALFFAVILVLVAREQLLVARTGVRTKADGVAVSRTGDRLWAAGGALTVVAVGTWFAITGTSTTATAAADTSTATTAAASPGSTSGAAASGAATSATPTRSAPPAAPVRPASKLGNLTTFNTIVDDVLAKTSKGDLPGAKARIKDLEVAWDDAEAGLKPRAPGDWHRLDSSIDGALTALRADNPTQAECLSAVSTLHATLNSLQGKS